MEYSSVLFMTYLYYFSAMCLPKGMKNAILIPTAHDEPPIYLKHYETVFESAEALIYNTYEEKEFVEKMFQTNWTPSAMAGAGIDLPALDASITANGLYGLNKYIVYAGRIDESKGCGKLFTYFQEYKKRNPGDLQLVLMGKAVMEVPKDSDIISLGFVSEENKFTVMRDSVALVLASEYESLSIVVLESMALGRPVLVNGDCEVLKGHCIRSNAGLYFTGYFEFDYALNYLLSHPEQYAAMRENARQYTDANCRWEDIVGRISDLIESVAENKSV
jgi:glycosyltransferase involved in cell wall biosynthesis